MATRRLVGWRIWERLLWLLPVAVLAQQVGLVGVRTADACAGGVPGEGWSNLRVPINTNEARLPIASDGFVVLRGGFITDDVEPDVPLPWVRATNEAGDELPGTLRVLRTQDQDGSLFLYLGWQADAPLVEGSVVKLSFSEAPEDAGAGGAENAPAAYETVELEVVGEPTPLPVPDANLKAWVEVRHGVGALVACDEGSDCFSAGLQVPTEEERVPGVRVESTLPSITGLVAWEMWAETRDPEDAALPPTATPRLFIERERDVIPSLREIVAFANHAKEHCAVVVVKDLRTGEESRSEPQCGALGTPTATVVDHDLGRCAEPPTAASAALWCADNPQDERCATTEPEPTGGQGGSGSGGSGSGGSDSGGSGSGGSDSGPDRKDDSPRGGTEPSNADSGQDVASAKARTSSGCRYSPSTGSSWLGVAAIGLVLLGAGRRRGVLRAVRRQARS
jgi:uncharacterized membrane protein YgcG